MTIVASLSIKAVAEGPVARVRMVFSRPAVSIDGVEHPLTWLNRYRFAVVPGEHEVKVYTGGKSAEATSVTFSSGPAERISLLATLTARDGFRYEIRRYEPQIPVDPAPGAE